MPDRVLTPQPLPREFAEPLDHARDRLGLLASTVLWFDDIGSTNTTAVAMAERGEPHGTLVVADAQRAGRGRLGRTWESPAGAGLYFSVVLRPPSQSAVLTLAAGVAVFNGLRRATGIECDLKWPNDVYAGGRKLAGILAEAGHSPSPFVVLGIGINVLAAAYPPDVASRATSVETELGRAADRGLLLAECLAALNEAYGDATGGHVDRVLDAWRLRARRLLNRPVVWDDATGQASGIARDIDASGALEVETATGVRRIIAGEVRWV